MNSRQLRHTWSPVKWGMIIASALFCISPLIATGLHAVPVPFPELISVTVVGGILSITALATRQFITPTVVATVILGTINANFPLPIDLANYSTAIIGSLFLAHLPLTALIVLGLYRDWHHQVGQIPVLLLGFAIVSGLGTAFGPRPEIIPGLFFMLFVMTLAIWVWTLQSSIRNGIISTRELLYVFVIAIGGHSVFAIVQLLNQSSFGLTRLGEGVGQSAVIHIANIASVSIGPYVSGLSGMSFQLSVLALMAFPICLGLGIKERHQQRIYYGFAMVLAVLIRVSASDAARGALLIVVPAFLSLLWWKRSEIPRSHIQQALVVLFFVSVISLIPSTVSGSPGEVISQAGGTASDTTSNGTPSTTQQLSLPFFDLSNLGGRTLQYVVALDLWLRNPLFGIGGMNYAHLAIPYGVPMSHVGDHAYLIHNIGLAVLTESGIIGSFCYFGAIASALGRGLRNNQSFLQLSAAIGLFAVFGYAFWHPFVYSFIGQFSFWTVIIAIAESK